MRARPIAADLACALLALVAAVAIYRGWRPHGGLWLNVPRTPLDEALRLFAERHPLPNWVRYSMPDALWQYAFGATMGAVWRGEPLTKRKLAFLVAPGALGIVVELGQGIGLVPGTFDVVDLATSAAAAFLAVALHGGAGATRERSPRAATRPPRTSPRAAQDASGRPS